MGTRHSPNLLAVSLCHFQKRSSQSWSQHARVNVTFGFCCKVAKGGRRKSWAENRLPLACCRVPSEKAVLRRFEKLRTLLCVAKRRATRPNGEWGYSTRRHMLGPERPEAVSPERDVVLTDLQSSIDCQQTFLSLSLSLSLSSTSCRILYIARSDTHILSLNASLTLSTAENALYEI